MDEVGLEAEQLAADDAGVAKEERVELEVFFDANGGTRSPELEGAEFGDLFEGVRTGSGADAEEGQRVALGIGDEVTAGVCDAIDLVERIGEIGYTRHAHGIRVQRGLLIRC